MTASETAPEDSPRADGKRAARSQDPAEAAPAASRQVLGLLAAALIFGASAAVIYGGLWQSHSTPIPRMTPAEFHIIVRADVVFEAWLVSRNARTLTTRPHRLFDTEHCAPAEKTLTLGIPMVTMGVLAIPFWYATHDPVLTYNLTLISLSLLGALAMYLLIVSWTGLPAAGIVAGLLYGFHASRMIHIQYPSVWDTTWIVFALLFTERLLASGRWRDAVGLAAAVTLQIGASFYTLLAAVFTTPPFLVWLLCRDRLRRVSPAQLGFVISIVALAAAALLGPYLFTSAAEGGLHRSEFVFAWLSSYLPGESLFPGWGIVTLAAIALVHRHADTAPRIAGDPRGPLLIGGVLVALIAAGDTNAKLAASYLPPEIASRIPDLYGWLASFLPGLDAVRGVLRLSEGVQLVLAVLAGLGAAALIRRSGRRAPAVAIGLVLLASFDAVRAPALGFERPYQWDFEEIRPSPRAVQFFAELERRGNTGPILEMPVDRGIGVARGPTRILLSTYHERRTSACFGSYVPPGRDELSALARRLPAPDAIASLDRLGFTTIVVHRGVDPPKRLQGFLNRLERAARSGQIERVHHTPERVAYALRRSAGAEDSATKHRPR